MLPWNRTREDADDPSRCPRSYSRFRDRHHRRVAPVLPIPDGSLPRDHFVCRLPHGASLPARTRRHCSPARVPSTRRANAREEPWRYFSKVGLLIRAGRGRPVTVNVPTAWGSRLAISWGNNTNTVYSSLRIPRCPRLHPSKNWNAQAGSISAPARPASSCLPRRPAYRDGPLWARARRLNFG